MKLQPFAQHEQALHFRARRNEVLSSNIANADTPGYKARDVDFSTALQDFRQAGGELMYRVPTQPSLDGNTVQADVEQAAFAENAVQYRASLTFLNGTIQTLRYALKGGD